MAELEFIQIQWSCGNIEEARRVSRFLVQERLVACANITPWMESVYMWDNRLETDQECKVIFKTRKDNWEKVKQTILDNCTYEVPEILWFPIGGGHEEYLSWAAESTQEIAPQTTA